MRYIPRWQILCTLVFIAYLIFTIYSSYVILFKDDQQSSLSTGKKQASVKYFSDLHMDYYEPESNRIVVYIWGKAAISLFLWQHVLKGPLDTLNAGLVYNGTIIVDNLEFKFLSGPGVVQGRVPRNIKYLILVVNGRDETKIAFAKTWLDYLDHLPYLQGVAVMMLGDEKCRNDWILKYMHQNGGKVKAVWLTYDSPLVDNFQFYQWPLGVATYRSFPRLEPNQVEIANPRNNLCNFYGTMYHGSSREILAQALNRTSNKCLVKLRFSWQPNETEESLASYVATLLDSELTLSPVGINSECYRIYEALSCGSIPVVEDVLTDGECGGKAKTPYRLLKLHNAPVIYVKNWKTELSPVLEQHQRLSNKAKSKMRKRVLEWYQSFIDYHKKHFINVIKNRLLTGNAQN